MESRAQKRARKAKERKKKQKARGNEGDGQARGGLSGFRRGLRRVAGSDARDRGRLWDVLTWVAVGVAALVFVARRCG